MYLYTESGQPICGNGLVEAEEQCDCGYSDQCKDPCCYNANEAEDKKCKLQPGKLCRSDVTFPPFLFGVHSRYHWVVGWPVSGFYPTVQAKARAAQNSALLRAQVTAADRSLNVPKRACATEAQLCVPPPNQRRTSPSAIKKHKSALAGYVQTPTVTLRCFMWAWANTAASNRRHVELLTFPSAVSCTVNCTGYLNWKPLSLPSHWTRFALARSAKSTNWRCARAAAKMARMSPPNCATCAAWRNVSEGRRHRCSLS